MSGLANIFKLFFSVVFKKKLILILIFLAQCISIFSALFLYGFFYGIYNDDIGEYVIKYENGAPSIDVMPSAIAYEKLDYPILVTVSVDPNGIVRCDIGRYRYVSLGRVTDNASTENEILVPKDTEHGIGDIVELFGKEYKVVGLVSDECFIINVGSITDDMLCYSVDIIDYTIRSAKDAYSKAATIEQLFNTKPTFKEPLSTLAFMKQNTSVAVLIIGVIVLASCSTSLGFLFFLSEGKKTVRSLRASGMSNTYANLILFLSVFAITFAGCLVGSLLYILLNGLWIQGLTIPVFYLKTIDYIVMNLLMLLVPLITLLYVGKKNKLRG